MRYQSGQSGSVLILVVWMLALFSFWVFTSASSGVFSLGVGRRFEGDLKAYALARAAIPHIQKILDDDETPKHDGAGEAIFLSKSLYEKQSLGEGTFNVFYWYPNPVTGYPEKITGIIDEERKLNLNTVETDILTGFLTLRLPLTKTFTEKHLNDLVASIEDWRDEDNDRRDGGAEKYDYLALKKPYECKNGPFESVEELLLVKGITPEIYKRLAPYLTVYGSGKININTAPPVVLAALGIDQMGVSGITAFKNGADGELGTDDDDAVKNAKAITAELSGYLSDQDVNCITLLMKKGLLTVASETFSFTSEGRLSSYKHSYKISAVMKRDGQILAWQEN